MDVLPQVLITIGLLAGPTVGWLLYRRTRRRLPSRWLADYESEPANGPATIDELLGSDFIWSCRLCGSLNHVASDKCYRCHAARPSADPHATPIDPTPIPLMAAAPVTEPPPTAASREAVPVPPTAALRRRRRAVMAAAWDAEPMPTAARSRSLGGDGTTARTQRTEGAAIHVDEYCPLLGLRADRSTHFQMAYPDHRCHAFDRPTVIERAHQESYCLTSRFNVCVIYGAYADVASGPAGPSRRGVSSMS